MSFFSSSKGKSKSGSSGLRILWIPGSRKSHPKGRYNATNKHISYTTPQKKSEVWTLGGSRAQRELFEVSPSEGPIASTSANIVVPVASTLVGGAGVTIAAGADTDAVSETAAGIEFGAVAGTKCAMTTTMPITTTTTTAESVHALQVSTGGGGSSSVSSSGLNLPTTPNSTTSTAPLQSMPSSPFAEGKTRSMEFVHNGHVDSNNGPVDISGDGPHREKPLNTLMLPPVLVTTAEIIDVDNHNRFALLANKTDKAFDEMSLSDFPSVPTFIESDVYNENSLLNNSSGTTVSTLSTSTTTSPKSDLAVMILPGAGTVHLSPSKSHKNRNHSGNQEDINSIQSIADARTPSLQIPAADFDWIDEIALEQNNKELMHKNKRKKQKKKLNETKELDQLDGVSGRYMRRGSTSVGTSTTKLKEEDDDEKMVKCLYYSLMCCDCTIS